MVKQTDRTIVEWPVEVFYYLALFDFQLDILTFADTHTNILILAKDIFTDIHYGMYNYCTETSHRLQENAGKAMKTKPERGKRKG